MTQRTSSRERYSPLTILPFALIHAAALAGAAVTLALGVVTWGHVLLCAALYAARMFGITAGYHRYFAHRSYKLGRGAQLAMAVLASTSAQKGVLWWAAHHRAHHQYSDTEEDIHSPIQRGFWWSHMGWLLSDAYDETDWARIKDFARYPELVWLNRLWVVPPLLLALAVTVLGDWTSLIWGFLVSTVLLWHGTFFINSLAHVFGRRRYDTTDTSRNSLLLALITLGEGWHNNHHHYQTSVRQGFFWWEIDLTYLALLVLERLGVARDLRRPPDRVLVRTIRWQAAEQLRERLATLQRFRLRFRLEDAERALERLPAELRERMAYAEELLTGLCAPSLRGAVADAERAWQELPSPEELLERLPSPHDVLEQLPSREDLLALLEGPGEPQAT